MTRRIGFVIGLTAAFAFVRRLRSSWQAHKSCRYMSDAESAQMERELDNCVKVGTAPLRWYAIGIYPDVPDAASWDYPEQGSTYQGQTIFGRN